MYAGQGINFFVCYGLGKIGVSCFHPSTRTAADREHPVLMKFDQFETGDRGDNITGCLKHPVLSQVVHQVPASMTGIMIDHPPGLVGTEPYLIIPDKIPHKDGERHRFKGQWPPINPWPVESRCF